MIDLHLLHRGLWVRAELGIMPGLSVCAESFTCYCCSKQLGVFPGLESFCAHTHVTPPDFQIRELIASGLSGTLGTTHGMQAEGGEEGEGPTRSARPFLHEVVCSPEVTWAVFLTEGKCILWIL